MRHAEEIKLSSATPTVGRAYTLVVMEVVLGIDNLIFISILTNRLPGSAAGSRTLHRH